MKKKRDKIAWNQKKHIIHYLLDERGFAGFRDSGIMEVL